MSAHRERGPAADPRFGQRGAGGTSPEAPRRAPGERSAALKLRRATARRRTRLARVDLAISVLVAVVLLLIVPGLAIAGIVALVALFVCCASLLLARRRRRRGERGERAGG
ncbi:MAG TPA: hypothetical protein VHT27_01145 [Solirubrobacteraceae bacterium]|jgi:Flp pilus assembly protein TadB|nr:hypothetical protein [Solirubrobacteraceae bacterium]